MTLRVLAQNILSGAWISMDLPVTRDPDQPRWEMSGAGSFSGRIEGDRPWLRNNNAAEVLQVWQTALYVELDDDIVWGGLLQESTPDGPDWQLTAYGFTSYAEGMPYTGDYQKLVGVDPGLLWAKLWQHLQGQPDGNLGLQSVMPADLGPNIGTKDEPYELSWWEAKDVGSELSQLASEAPFDYVESHGWAVPAHSTTTGALPTVRLGDGNLLGAKIGDSHGNWSKNRADGQAELIGSMQRDIFVAEELHEDVLSGMPAGAHQWFAGRMRALVHPAWQLAVGDGGNHALYRSDRVRLVSTTVRQGIDDPSQGGTANLRSATLWTFEDIATGYRYPVSGHHFHGNDLNGTSRQASRVAEAHDVDALVGGPPSAALVCGDFNRYSMDPGDVYGIIQAETGLVPLNVRTTPKNATLNSLGAKHQGRWIDNILSHPAVWDVADAAGVPTRGLTDHHLWLQADFTPRAAAVDPAAGGTVSRTVRHTVELSYPRAGRRRQDLRFAQGENILEVVVPKRSGEEFANSVVTLGKGEGAKTLRGTSTVRDGRLRRVTVYTDKLASSKARCDALAARERGYRNLGARVESVLVDGSHPNAPMGSWALGDDILVEARGVPHVGDFADWFRIMSWSLVADSTARLTLERADAFTYGPVTLPPADDVPDLDAELDGTP